ncbi:MAG: bifunctional fucokinase/L-fucose-1-P-guanylyltransferase [Lentisphaerae bacterium]|nr:bifunctional fucokinase/L-fucose-1-P-guanylyltransferase [Lentisphaerota bacterium]
MGRHMDILVSLPHCSASVYDRVRPLGRGREFVASDPPGAQLGSGGGTVHMLLGGWRSSWEQTFDAYMNRAPKLVLHGSGESRRLPAYAPIGKPLVPVPVFRGLTPHAPDMTLLDLQVRSCSDLFRHASPHSVCMIACGDVLLRYSGWLPVYPDADVVIVGIPASAEEASRHGVMFCEPGAAGAMSFFLQKPDAVRVRKLAAAHPYFLDTGVWLLSRRALDVLFAKCGVPAGGRPEGGPAPFDLYGSFGPALGMKPERPDPEISALSCAVLPLPNGRFYHFGTNRSLLTSVRQLMNPADERRSFGDAPGAESVHTTVQNSVAELSRANAGKWVWIENSHVPSSWTLTDRHVLTGVPPNDWRISLPEGVCLDFAPVESRLCVRSYGFEDGGRGALCEAGTLWMGRPAGDWFAKRGLKFEQCGPDPTADIHTAALFPALPADGLSAEFVQWLVDENPGRSDVFARLWLEAPRYSALALLEKTDIATLSAMRRARAAELVARMTPAARAEAAAGMDLERTAEFYVANGLAPAERVAGLAPVPLARDRMFRSRLAALGGGADAEEHERGAFSALREAIVVTAKQSPVTPRRNVLEDQIVWGRSPVRLDIAGGWTDTPPYCMEKGGRVVNLAADLNGQPPIQVFARLSERPGIRLRSIDLGVDHDIADYGDLREYGRLGSGFGIARAALCLCGFSPDFHAGEQFKGLADQLRAEIGCGIEVSMLAAVPKGSGLGTSSILASTLLGTLSELLGLGWNSDDLFFRTLALEQMLTSGGGWQDQVGGVLPGVKLIESEPGLIQRPAARWLPENFFAEPAFADRILLYYTGLTRVAHNILGEIVRGIFLNSSSHMATIEEIGRNAAFAADALQKHDWDGFIESVRRSWRLNMELDPGTCPAEVAAILARVESRTSAVKLLGAGGGGYMLMLAPDAAAARAVREELTGAPPNPRARFVKLSLSRTGFQVTRS